MFPLLLGKLICEFTHHPSLGWILADVLSCAGGDLCKSMLCFLHMGRGEEKGYLMVLVLFEAILRGDGELDELCRVWGSWMSCVGCRGAWDDASCPLWMSPP